MEKRNDIRRKTFPVLEMSCAACAARVEKTLNRQPGVEQAAVNYAAATADVWYDPALCSPEALKQAVQAVGYDLVIPQEEDARQEDGTAPEEDLLQEAEEAHRKRYLSLKRRATWALLLAIPVAAIGMFGMNMPYANPVMWLLSTPVILGPGREFFVNAWRQLKHGSTNMDTLVACSTGIAYLFSLFNLLFPEFWLSRGIQPHVYFEAASVIIAFILLGRWLEERAKGDTSSAIKKLMELRPQTVYVQISAPSTASPSTTTAPSFREIPIEQVKPGNIIRVKPGERIAVDGTVTEGNSYVDESMLTGEPTAVAKRKESPVFAGTVNQKGSFCFRAGKVGKDTLLAKIVHAVQEAQGSKAPVQRLADKIAGIFVPVILSIALLTLLAWVMLDEQNGLTHGMLAMVTVLIIACPCALGLATPTAIMAGIGKGAESGILIRDAGSLEMARRIDTVIVDKTGTVTEGHPVVNRLLWDMPEEGKEAANIFYSLEKLSEHPLAEALVSHLSKASDVPIEQFESLTGRGIRGTCCGKTYYAGNRMLMEERHITLPAGLQVEAGRLETEAQTVIWLADSKRALGIAAIADRIKPGSIEAIRQLRQSGIEVCMLTGDNETTAQAIARQAGIRSYQAGMLPTGKAAFIRQLQQQGKQVAMVGDGINDSAALAQANLGIAMGSGSDIAMDAAHMTIISSDLTKIPEALRLSRLTVRTIRQNLFWAFIYNLIGVPVAAGVLYPLCGFLLNPMIAGAAMAFSSVSVVSNSLRLKRKKMD